VSRKAARKTLSRRTKLITLISAIVVVVLAALGGLYAALNTGGEAAPTSAATPAATASEAVVPTGDGVLRVLTLFTMTGDAAASGDAQVAGTSLAAREVSEQAGGIDAPIELIHRDAAGDVTAALAEVASRGIDVVLWDTSVPVPADAAATVEAAGATLITVADFVSAESLVVPDDAFSARLRSADPGLTDLAGGAEAYDALIATALAATLANDDGGASIAAQLGNVVAGSAACASWGECLSAVADGQDSLAYAGAAGPRA
jgi:hypothetical protein